ncbi:MAG: hypothetical protein FJ384_04585 [Verrucomicrobia bacterium]|nr:hypothetical protein [Verrucomicrobiota bacterium]
MIRGLLGFGLLAALAALVALALALTAGFFEGLEHGLEGGVSLEDGGPGGFHHGLAGGLLLFRGLGFAGLGLGGLDGLVGLGGLLRVQELLPGGFVDGFRTLGGDLLAALVALAFALLGGGVALGGVGLGSVLSEEAGRGDQGQEECEFDLHGMYGDGRMEPRPRGRVAGF